MPRPPGGNGRGPESYQPAKREALLPVLPHLRDQLTKRRLNMLLVVLPLHQLRAAKIVERLLRAITGCLQIADLSLRGVLGSALLLARSVLELLDLVISHLNLP